MTCLSEEVVQSMDARFKQLASVVLATVYTTIQNLAPESVTVVPGFDIGGKDFGLFILATGAMAFGKGVGSASASLGVLLTEFQPVLQGQPLPPINLGLILETVTLALGVWLAGFLENGKVGDFIPNNFSELFSLKEITKVIRKGIVAVVGIALAGNFTFIYGSQFVEGGSFETANVVFLQQFITNASILLITVPVSMFAFDAYEAFNRKKEEIKEMLNKKITYRIEVEESAEFLNVSLPETSFVQGQWVPIEVTIMNPSQEKKAFQIEGVFTTKFYPHMDKTPVLKPGEGWKQTFFVMPGKQNKVSGRIRFTTLKSKEYKYSDPEETIVEIEGQTRSPTSLINSLLGLSGINFGVLGASVVWEQTLEYLSNPQQILSEIQRSFNELFGIIVAEVTLFIGLVGGMYFRSKRKSEQFQQKLSFAGDLDDQSLEELTERAFRRAMARYGPYLTSIFRAAILLATLGFLGYFGFQGFQIATGQEEQVAQDETVFTLGASMIGIWIVGFRGLDIINRLNLKTIVDPSQKNNFIIDFRPNGEIRENQPVEIIMKAINTSENPGMRIKFEGTDSIAPPLIELHIDPGATAQFKVVLTPNQGIDHQILALAYPFFTKNKKYLDFDETEPFAKQIIHFKAVPQTSMGISKDQQDQLKKMGSLVVGATAILAVVNQIFPIGDIYEAITTNAPTIVGMQIPFFAAYYRISSYFNKPKAGGLEG